MGKLALIAMTMIFGNSFADARPATVVIETNRYMFSGSSLNRYLDMTDLLISEEARQACPNGVAEVLDIKIEVKGRFEVSGVDSTAQSNQRVKTKVIARCAQ